MDSSTLELIIEPDIERENVSPRVPTKLQTEPSIDSAENVELDTSLVPINIATSKAIDKENNETANVSASSEQRQRPMVIVFTDEYARLLKQEVQLIQYKESCNAKALELKRLQDQLSYFKKQISMLRNKQMNDQDDATNEKTSLFANVMPLH